MPPSLKLSVLRKIRCQPIAEEITSPVQRQNAQLVIVQIAIAVFAAESRLLRFPEESRPSFAAMSAVLSGGTAIRIW